MRMQTVKLKMVLMLLCVVLFACRGKKQNAVDDGIADVPKIVFSFSDTIQKQSDLFEIENVIRLETIDASLVAEPSQVICRSSGFYFLDDEIGKQVVKFDANGKFLFAVNKRGRGPEEFLSIYGISVDRFDRILYLFDAEQGKVIHYDAHTGDYIRYTPVGFNAYSFSILPDGAHFVFYNSFKRDKALSTKDGNPNFIVTDSCGKIMETFAYYNSGIESPNIVCTKDVFASLGKEFYCYTAYSDRIYSIDQNLFVNTPYLLDYGNDNQVKNNDLLEKIAAYGGIDFDKSKEGHRKAGIYKLLNLNSTNRYLYFVGNHSQTPGMFYYLYDKMDKKTINVGALEKNLLGSYLYFMASDESFFYLPVPISYLKYAVEKAPQAFSSKLVETLRSLNENENPIIIKLRIKNLA